MSESGKTTPPITKAYEIAYALSRVAAKIPEKSFGESLMSEGVRLLGFVATGEYEKAEKSLSAAEYFIKLGTGIGSVNFANGETLLAEIAQLNGMIAGLLAIPKTEPADLSGIFTSAALTRATTLIESPVAIPAKPVAESGNGNDNDMGVLLKSGERQSAILGRIRQSGNCRIKELQDLFPGCSERTLRYDLQSLTEQNLIEKIGTGGPAVFYKNRE
jgi:hypothetical protein